MLNIYFTASTNIVEAFRFQNAHILAYLKKQGCNVISGEQIINPGLLKKDEKLDKKIIFEREKSLIDRADLVVAEVTKPSTGVGGEIVYALIKGKPVLALVYKENEDVLSPMVAGNPSDNLFLEHYDMDNIDLIISGYLKHIKGLKNRKGKLIVVDGGDGSGKTTQAKLLIDYLKTNKIPVKYMDFPRYYMSFHGRTVAQFLRGEFGSLNQVSPYLASLAYALDRASVKEEMESFLRNGGYIIANRYATSNMAHQGAKFKSEKEKSEYLKWVYELEYKVHKIPKEDIVIYLLVPWQTGFELTKRKGNRKYLNGAQSDIHEKDLEYRRLTEEMYLTLAKKYKHWATISCIDSGTLLAPNIIQKKIRDVLVAKKIILDYPKAPSTI